MGRGSGASTPGRALIFAALPCLQREQEKEEGQGMGGRLACRAASQRADEGATGPGDHTLEWREEGGQNVPTDLPRTWRLGEAGSASVSSFVALQGSDFDKTLSFTSACLHQSCVGPWDGTVSGD